MDLLKECIDLLQTKNAQTVFFDRSLTIKLSPHQYPIKVKIVYAEGGKLFVVDKQWNKIEVTTDNAETVANSIYQRLKMLDF